MQVSIGQYRDSRDSSVIERRTRGRENFSSNPGYGGLPLWIWAPHFKISHNMRWSVDIDSIVVPVTGV